MAQLVDEAESPGQALTHMFELSERVLFDDGGRVCASGKFEVDSEVLSDGMVDGSRRLETRHLERVADLHSPEAATRFPETPE